jgi:hypothetical protein
MTMKIKQSMQDIHGQKNAQPDAMEEGSTTKRLQ